ncbi:MAG: glycosyl transferase [Pseudomonadota bacterium]|nr:heptosyltransferase [Rubrivivax sp.]NLZ41655.1 glycosyltransferase family 9 protein [Comamonadaceae bacterium]
MPAPRPLVVRLRNWVGDVTLGVPALARLADAGYALQLVGKAWARELLAGQGWPVHVLPARWRERVALLRRLGAEARAVDAAFDRRLNALCLPYSLSSALEFRLAGLRAIGHAYEGRSLLLAHAVRRPAQAHELEVYWQLAGALLGAEAALPQRIGLRIATRHREQAEALRRAHGIERGCIVICPFAGGTWAKQDKTWPEFADFAATELPRLGRTLLVCPGPGEEGIARAQFAGAYCLEGVGLGTYAALLADAALMVANDTGPGHIAAAVGTPLVSVLGPSDPAQWRAWGPSVQIVRGERGWPTRDAVAAASARALAAADPGA